MSMGNESPSAREGSVASPAAPEPDVFELESAMSAAELADVRRWELAVAAAEAAPRAVQRAQYMSMSRSSVIVTAPPAKLNRFSLLSVLFAALGGLPGVIFGHLALVQISRTGERGSGLAFLGLIIGYVVVAVLLVGFIVTTVLQTSQ